MVGTKSSHVVDGDVMVSMLPSSVVDGGYKVQSPKTRKLVFVASLLSILY